MDASRSLVLGTVLSQSGAEAATLGLSIAYSYRCGLACGQAATERAGALWQLTAIVSLARSGFAYAERRWR